MMSDSETQQLEQRFQRALTRERAEKLLEDKSRELFHANEEINKQLVELQKTYEELKQTQAQLLQSEKMASVGQLAAGVAHEINNPMGFILSNLSTLDNYFASIKIIVEAYEELIHKVSSDSENYAAQIQMLKELKDQKDFEYLIEDTEETLTDSIEGGKRITAIVQGLKDYSRVDQEEYAEIDINHCLETTLKVINNEIKYNCEIEKNFGDLALVMCNAGKLNQVFTNLLVNASHAIEEQGQITIKTRQLESAVSITIADTGQGIAEEHLAKIFDPFFTTKPVGQGTGLGLSISHGIIKEHHGEMTVESEVGKGTVFTIMLPQNFQQQSLADT